METGNSTVHSWSASATASGAKAAGSRSSRGRMGPVSRLGDRHNGCGIVAAQSVEPLAIVAFAVEVAYLNIGDEGLEESTNLGDHFTGGVTGSVPIHRPGAQLHSIGSSRFGRRGEGTL